MVEQTLKNAARLLEEYHYELPEERIAQQPVEPRDSSRLLVLHRSTGRREHRTFHHIVEYLQTGDTLVLNNTRVSARRLRGVKTTGAQVEALLLREVQPGVWEAMVRPGRRLPVGSKVLLEGQLQAEIIAHLPQGMRLLRFEDALAVHYQPLGEIPLPPYIRRKLENEDRYQTVYAAVNGSAAAPTAGLHFTPELLQRIREIGVRIVTITLHVGIATFRHPEPEQLAQGRLHPEWYTISEEAVEAINSTPGRIVAVGTTCVRALESAAVGKRRVEARTGSTELFIMPGFHFQVVEALVTNFHMPASTPLLLTCAFAGKERVLDAYREALTMGYRFLSFGDAMLIL
ncbi:MAG: tRNA preQ1(34) S-adenosylmethionine ribosyltransferase-isomerase QueA [Armatimonadota bacterium]|nr:tRNA preQ1(34) S-adenosylmethionine ribosyltransferase-isomerase QueA [bacterium]MDW8320539.1 tRNA preQ1(34) S-adenosylmethionine ribosyltransferase-isomerase QueA [Armatimonadota bacterium]